MSQPAVNIHEQDNALGVLPASAGKLFAVVGAASSGPFNTPATYGRVKDLVATFGGGPAVEMACRGIDRFGKPVVFTRTAQSTAGTVSAVGSDADGTSVVSLHATPTPNDDAEIVVKIVNGGTRGVAGITYQESLDGARNFGPTLSLGTATAITITGMGGVTFDIAAGTLVAGDIHTARATAPAPTSAELGTALDVLKGSIASWELCGVACPVGVDEFDMLETKFGAMFAVGKFRAWIGNARMPNVAETEAQYATALGTAFASKVARFGEVCAGAIKVVSSVSGRKYRRPLAFAVAPLEASVSEEVDTADVAYPLDGVSIRDANGNADEHDESLNPGLDDARFTVARTHEGYAGVYINRPRIMSAEGSDFQIMPNRRVLNLAHEALRIYFIKRLNKPILVNKATGLILESEAREIQEGAISVMRDRLLAKPKASGVDFVLSRIDNLLSSKTLTGAGRVIPLAYPEFINLDVGYLNPALQIVAV